MKFITCALLVLGVLCISNCQDAQLPSYIKPCEYKTSKFESCVREQIVLSLPLFTKGIENLGVPSIDPVKLDDINIDGNGLKLRFTNAELYGVGKSQITDFKVNLDEEKFVLAFKGNMTLSAKYTIDGQILILPIKGQGDAKVKAQNLDVTISSKMTHFKDDKGEHFKLVSPSYNYNIGRTKFEFQNLFNGNKQLSDATHAFANGNWRQIMDDLAPPVVKQIVRTGVRSINKFFAAATIDQLIIGYST